jgi:flagellar protein FlaG
MLVEQVAETGKNTAPPVQIKLPALSETGKSDQEAKKPVKEPDPSQVAELVADVQKNLNIIHNVDLKFSVHEASGETIVTVIDEDTGKVIREIPSSEVLQLAAKIDAMVGMIFDKMG